MCVCVYVHARFGFARKSPRIFALLSHVVVAVINTLFDCNFVVPHDESVKDTGAICPFAANMNTGKIDNEPQNVLRCGDAHKHNLCDGCEIIDQL